MPFSKFQWIARAGYSARAVVFFLVGGLALFSGLSGGESDTKSALDILLQQPLGKVWVGLIALGLLGFVVWRLAQSIGNADRHEHDAKGIAVRSALLGSAFVYIGLSYYAAERALGLVAENKSGQEGLAAWAMSQPFGKYLAAAIGIGFIAGGILTILKGTLRKYERYLKLDAKHGRAITVACVYGLVARGVLFMIVGGFFVYAAFTVSPEQAGSILDALNWIRGLPFGGALYTIVAVGLASFGAYNLVQARYRMVRGPKVRHEIKNAVHKSAASIGK